VAESADADAEPVIPVVAQEYSYMSAAEGFALDREGLGPSVDSAELVVVGLRGPGEA
jgi:hypothetical protein